MAAKHRSRFVEEVSEGSMEVPIDELWGEEEVVVDPAPSVVDQKVLPFLEELKISKTQKVALSEELVRRGYSNPKGTVCLLGSGLKGVLSNLYVSVTGRGGMELVGLYQRKYLEMLGPGEKPRH